MKNLFKIILIIGFVFLIGIGFVSCASNIDFDKLRSDFGEFIDGFGNNNNNNNNKTNDNIDYSEYKKDYNQDSPKGSNGICEETYVTKNGKRIWYNVFGLPYEPYGNGNSGGTLSWSGGDNGKNYLHNVFDIVTPIYTDEYLEDSLKEAKEEIALENMSVNYQYLFDNKTYTNSNATYELSLDTAVGETSFIQFESKMFSEFDNAIARGENFLIYCSEYSVTNDEKYGKPFAYGYVEGLGYIIISTSRYGYITISVENKYFTRIDVNNNISTWYSNEDAIKVPVARGGDIYKGVFWDYSPNMIRATTLGLFNKNKESYYYSDNFSFIEGNFTGIISDNEVLHLYGANPYNVKNSDSFYSGNYLKGYLTDFNNFYYGNNTYALFGELADKELKKIVNTMFSVEMQPCNDFEEECNWYEEQISSYSNHSDELKEMYADSEKGTMTNLKRITKYFDLGAVHNLNYGIGDVSNINDKYYVFLGGDCNFDLCYVNGKEFPNGASITYEWYESLKVKPYIKSYINNEGYVTVKNWSYYIGSEEDIINFYNPGEYESAEGKTKRELFNYYLENHNVEVDNKYIGLTTEDYDNFNDYSYSNNNLGAGEEYSCYLKEKYGWISNDGYVITDETNIFKLRFKN